MESFDGSNGVSASESAMSSLPGTEIKDDYEQQSSDVLGSVRVKEYMPWLMEQERLESVSFALFVQEFGFVDLEDATSVYEMLISSSQLRRDRRRAQLAKYEGFLRNNLQSFWSSHLLRMVRRETKTNLEIAITAKLLEDDGGDKYESACGRKSKRRIEVLYGVDGPLKENKRQERMTRDIDGDADDATEVSEAPSLFFDWV
ncbi:hypothetical protein EC957_008105 [Mortierella hygrophila]|uniref:Uncharacterized protein n=1 Tax=Mortierella hygrophila TaxID=979708 RepID=A0A9P6EWE1_9FUNG|nr:hypothetical protein EC957_008105 [Mortierella hygrophila]